MPRPQVMFVNVRRTTLEVGAAFHAARRAGYDVALLTDNPPAFPQGIVRDVEQVDTFDTDQGLVAAERLDSRRRIDGVVTWSDRDVELTASIARVLGLRGPSEASAALARDKYAMREALGNEPDLIPKYALVRSMADLTRAAEHVGYPSILKPTGAAGSIGVFSVDAESDLAPAFDRLTEITSVSRTPMLGRQSGQLILEERIPGSQHSVEGLVCDGEVLIAGVTDHLSTPPYHPDVQEIHPSRLPREDEQTVRALCHRVVQCLGLDWTAFHLECKLLPDGSAKLIEVAARIPGAHIGSHLIPMSTGIPYYENVVGLACGREPVLEPQADLVAGSRVIFAPNDGIFEGIEGVSAMLRIPAVQHITWEQQEGGRVQRPPADFVSWAMASVIAVGSTHDEVEAALSEADAVADVRVVTPTRGRAPAEEPASAAATEVAGEARR